MRMLDLFSGIGGFHKGFEQAGFKFDWVGFSEIDKYASAVYKHRFPRSEELGDITIIQPERDLPDHIDIICGGFPCQAFSVAGKRQGFDDTRGTLFFEIARILRYYRESGNPIPCVVLENVKGLLSHDNGRTFATIYGVLSDLGYTIEFQLLNTRWWIPQNRERIYIVCRTRGSSGPEIFPFTDSDREDGKLKQISNTNPWSRGFKDESPTLLGRDHKDPKVVRIADYRTDEGIRVREDGNSPCLTSSKTSHNDPSRMAPLLIKEATKKGYAEAEVGDSINLSVPNSKTRRGRVGKGEAQTLDTGMQQYTIQTKSVAHRTRTYAGQPAKIEERDDNVSNALNSATKDSMVKIKKIEIIGNLKGKDGHECHNVHSTEGIAPTVRENHGKTTMVEAKTQIRRLTPVECERLQGFPDMWTSKGVMDGKVVDMSDTQRYKQCGNAVTVDVVQAVAERIRPLFEDNKEV